MLRTVLVWSLLLGMTFAKVAQSQDSTCIFEANKDATVRIEFKYTTNEGVGIEQGSGFIVSPAGHVITNAHVVSPRIKEVVVQSATIAVRVGGLLNAPEEATLLARDHSNDLALLQLPPRRSPDVWPTVTVGTPESLRVGARLIGLGFGSSADLAIVPAGEKTAHNTIVDRELKPWWQTNLALNSGNSGGPVFGQLGTVVGVAVAKNDGAQLVTYVIPIARAQHLLDAAGVRSAQVASCALFPECRHASHGIERYEIDESRSDWSQWREGGSDRGAHCNALLARLQRTYPASTFTFLRDDEQDRDIRPPLRVIRYRYFCEFRRREKPVYELKRSISCLR